MNRSIGVIDSGVGGLTVVHEIMRQLPHERIVYLGDTKRCPYGSREKTEIIKFTLELVDYVLKYDLKLLIIACNTATAYTLPLLRERLEIPVIGVINPGSRAAIHATENQHIGIIGTEATIRSKEYEKNLKLINQNLSVERLACPAFVPFIESGDFLTSKDSHLIEETLSPLKESEKIDTLILGCTHYPLISKEIQAYFGENVAVISSSEETAREASLMLETEHLLRSEKHPEKHLFLMTGKREAFLSIYKTIFSDQVNQTNKAIIKRIELEGVNNE